METIQITDLQNNLNEIITSITQSQKQVWITDKGKLLVKISPILESDQKSWLGCMRGTGRITGNIIPPAESPETWEVLSK